MGHIHIFCVHSECSGKYRCRDI